MPLSCICPLAVLYLLGLMKVKICYQCLHILQCKCKKMAFSLKAGDIENAVQPNINKETKYPLTKRHDESLAGFKPIFERCAIFCAFGLSQFKT